MPSSWCHNISEGDGVWLINNGSSRQARWLITIMNIVQSSLSAQTWQNCHWYCNKWDKLVVFDLRRVNTPVSAITCLHTQNEVAHAVGGEVEKWWVERGGGTLIQIDPKRELFCGKPVRRHKRISNLWLLQLLAFGTRLSPYWRSKRNVTDMLSSCIECWPFSRISTIVGLGRWGGLVSWRPDESLIGDQPAFTFTTSTCRYSLCPDYLLAEHAFTNEGLGNPAVCGVFHSKPTANYSLGVCILRNYLT